MIPCRQSFLCVVSVAPAILGALLLLLPVASRATMMLDQVAAPNGGSFIEDDNTFGYQSFTVGVTGQLTEIDLWVIDPGPDLGYLNSGINLSTTFDPQSSNQIPDDGFTNVVSAYSPFPSNFQLGDPLPSGWVPFILTSPVAVTAGESLYFSLDAGMLTPVWGTSSYPNGSLTFLCYWLDCTNPLDTTAPMIPAGSVDFTTSEMAFRTWVDTPEPTVASLLAIAGVVVGALRRRRAT